MAPTARLRRASLLALGLMVSTWIAIGGIAGCHCPRFRQVVHFQSFDDSVAPLIKACKAGPAPGFPPCSPHKGPIPFDCYCAPLCERALAIIDPGASPSSLEGCQLVMRAGPPEPAGDTAVAITYARCD